MILGLTGQTGVGKSLVCSMLREWQGVEIIDCDIIARRVAQKGNRCLVDLAVEFSPLIIDSDGNLNRKKLAGIVFTDKAKLKRLNEIMFPYILEEVEKDIAIAQKKGAKVIVLDAPTLFESGADKLCDKILVVTADDDVRLRRIMQRDKLTPIQAVNRMKSQHSEKFFKDHADYIINNNGEKVELRLEVLELLNKIGL